MGHEAVASEVVHSHAYGKVGRTHRSAPRPRHASSPRSMAVPGYRDSMVGSIAQYRDRAPIAPRVPEKEKDAQPDKKIIGNRPHSGAVDKKSTDSAPAKRHHFIEPPKPRFNRFD